MKLGIPVSFLLFVTLVGEYVSGYNVVFFHAMATSSHRTSIWPLAEKLADSGHNVTYIFPVTKKVGSHPKIREFTPSKMIPILTNYVSDFDINIRLENKVNEWMERLLEISLKLCKAFYESPEIQEWLTQPDLKIDLILVDGSFGECAYGLIHKFKAKHITFFPLVIPAYQDPFGVVPESSSIPDIFYHAKPTEMTLFNRLITTIIPLVWRYKVVEYQEMVLPVLQESLNTTEIPPLDEIEKNASLVFLGNYFVEDYPMALPPYFVSYSGLWCSKNKIKAAKPLPENIAKFVNETEGFFYVSFGSATVASAMPLWMRNYFFDAFRAFPKHKFLWRWTGPVPEDAPKNALLLPWFPQHDILAHPKLKAFMTQTGRPSSQEALCHGVPLITMPIFADQDYNADRLEYLGATINMDINKISTEALKRSFQEMLDNPKYENKMKELSAMFKDRPIDPLDNLFFWTEYVMRHNTSLLKPLSMNQTWYQRRLLDVWGTLLVILLVLLGAIGLAVYLTVRSIVRTVFGTDTGKRKYD